MTRMAAGRTSHLTADEIAREARRQFDDAGGEPSIRSLAEALSVTPRAIYHYYANRNDIVEAVMALVWSDVFAEMAQDLDDPIHDRGDPVELIEDQVFTSLEDAERAVFRLRWKAHTGYDL